ncbi:MAG: V-type ATPase subunit [Clostridia bacterium]|nr:V-type ATPase subunit [Clostridia bacterium]
MQCKDVVFINGLVKSREKYLISRDKFMRMADCADAEEAAKTLAEYRFGGDVSLADVSEYEKLCDAEWEAFVDFLKEYSPNEKFFACFTAKNDFFNAECAVRMKNVKRADCRFMPEGSFSVATLKKAAEGKVNVPPHLTEPIRKAQALFDGGDASGSDVSLIFLRAYYAYMLKTVPSAEWKRFIVSDIDAKNVCTAIRADDYLKACEGFIDGGKLDKSILKLVADKNEQKALEKSVATPYFELIKLAFIERRNGTSLSQAEKAAADLPLVELKKRRFETDGLIPMLLYANYKVNEIKNVRLIMALKLCGADGEVIKRRLFECYER